MNDIDDYIRRTDYYREILEQSRVISIERAFEMFITTHRPDNMTPKKKLMAHKMGMTK